MLIRVAGLKAFRDKLKSGLTNVELADPRRFDNFPGGNANFTDDAGKGLSGLLGYPFSQPVIVPGPSGLASDRAVRVRLRHARAPDAVRAWRDEGPSSRARHE